MSPLCDYPLRFKPLFRRYLWGGRRLATMLGKAICDGDDYAESWEIVDHGDDQSIVAHGPLAGRTLGDLVREQPGAVLGSETTARQFPLLLKFLDCNRTLSVQVHPNDRQAARLDPPDLGKTEAWVVMAADPGSKIYAGLQEGVDRQSLAGALAAGRCEECLHVFEPQAGDCVFIPAGTVHALGAGLVIAEIQQASNTTFRLFDWNRVDAQGQPRPLHVQQSLEVIDFQRGPVAPVTPPAVGDPDFQRLVDCDKFVLDRCRWDAPREIGGDGRFRILAVLDGQLRLAGDQGATPLSMGDAALLPVAAGPTAATPDGAADVLEIAPPVS